MSDRPQNAMSSLLVQNRFILLFKSTINNLIYSILYFFKSSQYRTKAYCSSWIILHAFDPLLYKKRIVILCATILALFVSLMVILTVV
jgi:hypothetical protein